MRIDGDDYLVSWAVSAGLTIPQTLLQRADQVIQ
jgi:hypothetical protein